jgi:hypothetical protein
MMNHLWGDHFVDVVNREMANRHFVELHAIRPLTALIGALGLVFPWTPLVIGAVAGCLRQPRNERQPETTWLVAWFFLSVLPFLFMKSSERYMLAVSPIQATLGALWLERTSSACRTLAVRISVWLFTIVVALLCGFVIWFKLGIVGPTLCLVIAAWLCWQAGRNGPCVGIAFGVLVAWTVCVGFVYPRIGINAMPVDVPARIGGLTARGFMTPRPAMLSMRLGYSVQQFDALRFPAANSLQPASEAVFFEASYSDDFGRMVDENNFQVEELGRFKTIKSHKILIPFARVYGKKPDWRAAIHERSVEPLQMEIRYYRVTASAAP